MKHFLFILALCCNITAAVAAVTLDADLQAALPSGQYFLPAPPEVGSLAWQDDSVKYFNYRALGRVYNATTQDCWDSAWALINEQYYFALYRYGADSVMNAPFLSNVSWTKNAKTGKYTVSYTRNTTDFPKINELEQLCEAMKTANTSNLWRTRQRPFYYFNDWYKGKKYARTTANADSYPSGHGYFAGLFGMCMLYIDPDNALDIKKMTDEWAECRLILGAHWASDIEAGKQLGAIAFAIAMNHSQFHDLVIEAKQELADYRAAQQAPKHLADDKSGEQTLADIQAEIQASLTSWKAECDANPTKTMDIAIDRTFYCDGFYNTLCLPFDISEEDWSDSEKNPLSTGILKHFVSASIDNGTLQINIEPASSIVAGQPYLIRFENAADDILNPVFRGVRISTDNSGQAASTDMNCNGIFAPYQLPAGEAGGHLFLGANNTLFWPTDNSDYMRGFRAYFQVNNTAAGVAMRNRNAQLNEHQTPTAIDRVIWNENGTTKILENSQLIILHNGNKYNTQGLLIR